MNIDINSLEYRAFKKTVGFCSIFIIALTTLAFFMTFFPLKMVLVTFFVVCAFAGFYLIYNVNLDSLKFEESLKNIKK